MASFSRGVAMSFKIGNREFSVRVLEGRIVSEGRQYKSLVQDDINEIWISDRIPLHEQLDLVGRAVAAISQERPAGSFAPVVGVALAD